MFNGNTQQCDSDDVINNYISDIQVSTWTLQTKVDFSVNGKSKDSSGKRSQTKALQNVLESKSEVMLEPQSTFTDYFYVRNNTVYDQ